MTIRARKQHVVKTRTTINATKARDQVFAGTLPGSPGIGVTA